MADERVRRMKRAYGLQQHYRDEAARLHAEGRTVLIVSCSDDDEPTRETRGGRGPWLWGDEADPSPLYLELERRRNLAQGNSDARVLVETPGCADAPADDGQGDAQ